MHEAVIVSAVRTPVGKAPAGTLRGTRPDEMAATVIAGKPLRMNPISWPVLSPISMSPEVSACCTRAAPENVTGSIASPFAL